MVKLVLSSQFSVLGFWLYTLCSQLSAQDQSDYYRTVTLETPPGVNMEASGLAVLPDGKLHDLTQAHSCRRAALEVPRIWLRG